VTKEALQEAMERVETRERRKNPDFAFTERQRAAIDSLS
jgi:hypothetical protein